MDDVDGFGLGPEPGGVDVRVAGEGDVGLGDLGAKGIEDTLGFAEGGVEGKPDWPLARAVVLMSAMACSSLGMRSAREGVRAGRMFRVGDGFDANVLRVGAAGLATGWGAMGSMRREAPRKRLTIRRFAGA